MSLLDRYVLRLVVLATLATLAALTTVIWLTQALREFDLLTAKGQTLIVFLLVTGLSLPALIAIIAPVSLFIATLYALNKLNGDSELIVMSAAGVSPGRLMRPFAVAALLVGAIVAFMTIWAMPSSFRALRDLVTQIRADLVTKVLREGQFHALDQGITFHYREKSGDALLGILIQDRREPGKAVVYLAERGQTVAANDSSYLVLEKGSVQREQPDSRDAAIVAFERYAIDLGQFAGDGVVQAYKPRERSTLDLWTMDMAGLPRALAGRARAELHDRFVAPLYPIAFMAIAFAALGVPRTTRQGRGAAIAAAIVAVVVLRIAGFALASIVIRSALAVPLLYLLPLIVTAICLLLVLSPDWFSTLARGRARRPARPATA
jgi:lipopolysaccharide export system permease protein